MRIRFARYPIGTAGTLRNDYVTIDSRLCCAHTAVGPRGEYHQTTAPLGAASHAGIFTPLCGAATRAGHENSSRFLTMAQNGGLPISLHGQTVFWARGNRFYEIQKKAFTLSDFKAMERVTRTSKVKAYEVIESPVPVNSLTMKTRSNSLPQR